MDKSKIVDFKTAKGSHVHTRKEAKVTRMRAAFKSAREKFGLSELISRKNRKKKRRKSGKSDRGSGKH